MNLDLDTIFKKKPDNAVSKSELFTRKLYQSCGNIVDMTGVDPHVNTSESVLRVIYMWLYDTEKITLNTPFTVVCNLINSVAINFFTLDMSRCTKETVVLYNDIRKKQLNGLDRHREAVLSDFRVVFDLTCAGELQGEDFDY